MKKTTKKDGAQKTAIFQADISRLMKANQTVPMDKELREHLVETRRILKRVSQYAGSFDAALKDLEAKDRLDTFLIQKLLSRYNEAETLGGSVKKKRDDVGEAVAIKTR